MRVLVTGGAGFIGCHVVRRLLLTGFDVSAVDNFNDAYDPGVKRDNWRWACEPGPAALYENDILDREAMARLFRRENPEKIVHLAAWAGVRASIETPRVFTDVNVSGTAEMLELARTHRISQFVLGSTSSVYGEAAAPFSEHTTPVCPISPYGATKRAAELLCHTYARNFGIPITCLRFFTVYGPRQRPEMAIHKFTRLLHTRREIPFFGDGSTRRDYTYIDDIVDGVVRTLERPQNFDIFNLGDSRSIPLRELISLLEKAVGREARLRRLPSQLGDMTETCADITKAREVLGYSPEVLIEDGIPRFVEWFLRGAAAAAGQAH